jgi:predicted metalloprotease
MTTHAEGGSTTTAIDSWLQPDTSPDEPVQETPRPSFSVMLSAAALIIGAVVVVIAYFALNGPVQLIAGHASARASGDGQIVRPAPPTTSAPEASTTSAPPATTTGSAPTVAAPPLPVNPMAALARHPLSASTATMEPSVCTLNRFDPADDRQAIFFQEAKICADAAWSTLLAAAGLPTPKIDVVVVNGAPVSTPCGQVAPTDKPTQCQLSVFMTPAYLRDVEKDGRYPGRYFGVFLREYAKAVQEATGLTTLFTTVRGQTGAKTDDLDVRLAQQATCLAGIAAGAMAGQGAVDTNITNEIRDRLSTIDAPPDAKAWIAKGFQTRQLAACNSWAT